MPIDPRMVQWDEKPKAEIDPRMVKWDDAPKKPKVQMRSMDEIMAPALNYDGKNARGGMVRGAGSIGATLLAPLDAAARAMGVENDFIGRSDRRTGMDSALESMGVDTNAIDYKTNKLLTEIAGTSGVGGALANVGVRALPSMSMIDKLLSAVRTGGYTLGAPAATNLGGKAADLGIRAAGGALTGGATAGLVDPEYASTGAMVGGVAPVASVLVGAAGQKIGQYGKEKAEAATRAFNRNAPKNNTVRESIEAGYVIPPNMVKPSFKNQVVESISGKQATQQIASAKNEEVTGSLVRKALGIADDAPLNQGTLAGLRKTAGKAYAEVSSISKQAADDLEALKVARNEATGWFNAYNRSARPDDLAKAKDFRTLSSQLEDALEAHAASAGKPELIPALRDARKQIAKTYTVGRAVNDASGTVDARVLGRMHEKGGILSDGLDTAGKFASAFPTISKSQQQVGSQAAHNMKALASGGMGLGGAASMGPAGAVMGAVPFVVPPVARAAMFRKGAQEALVQKAPKAAADSALAQLLMNEQIRQMLIRAAPVAVTQ